ncbi:alpha/beta fold hydrolase [Curtobacterium sp. PhB136]|uniref:alpha/beta fold hydrolase n=1 Tax=Curtobacterium sp. PhB136 TaxID=2485181 RepID=UPI0010D6EB13|nr:alpha/beta fold hydrolase [Curtobacterium sp. PhB136]TCK62904.1 alpha/beta hydrolase family protein [Curtobacterium sp. PhB136]
MTTHHGWSGLPAIRAAVQVPPSARAGVVICPPLGQEGVIAYRTLRLLADRLEARGVGSVRYDPSGRGDSGPDADPDAQVRSAVRAAAVLRTTGVSRIVFVGLASSAFVAAAAARDEDALVLWDAPESGRAWLRRQRALASITIGPSRVVDDVQSLIGIDVDPAEAAVLSALRFAPRTAATAVFVRPGGRPPKALGDVQPVEVPGTAELLDGTSIHARIPSDAVDRVVSWIDEHVPAATVRTRPPVLDTVVDLDHGVAERIVHLGPEALFAVETAPARSADDGPVVVLHNGAAEHRVGATDYQVTLARALAREGARVVRVDRRGTGESSVVCGQERDHLFAQEWIDDQSEIVAALGVPADRLALVGMCAGAWVAGRARAEAPRLVVQISPNDYRRRPAAPGSYSDAVRAVDSPSPARLWLRERYNALVPEELRARIARRDRAGGVVEHVRPLVTNGTDVVLITADEDAELFHRLGGGTALRRWAPGGPGGSVALVHVPGGDHSLFSPTMRAAVLAEVRSRVAAAFPVHA